MTVLIDFVGEPDRPKFGPRQQRTDRAQHPRLICSFTFTECFSFLEKKHLNTSDISINFKLYKNNESEAGFRNNWTCNYFYYINSQTWKINFASVV